MNTQGSTHTQSNLWIYAVQIEVQGVQHFVTVNALDDIGMGCAISRQYPGAEIQDWRRIGATNKGVHKGIADFYGIDPNTAA